jgi:TonB family protein
MNIGAIGMRRQARRFARATAAGAPLVVKFFVAGSSVAVLGLCAGLAGAQQLQLPDNGSPPSTIIAAPPADHSQELLVFEKVRGVIRYGEDGTGSKESSARVRVQSYAGIQMIGQLIFPYNGVNERVEIKSVRVIKPDGKVEVAGAESVVDVSSPMVQEAPMYTDARQKHVSVPDLAVGDVVEYEVVTRVFAPLTSGQFWNYWDFVSHSVCLDEELTLDVPAARMVKVKSPDGVTPVIREEGQRRKYTWRTENKTAEPLLNLTAKGPGFDPAAILQGLSATPPRRMLFSTFQTWDEVGTWYNGLAQERQGISPEVHAKADEVTRGAATDLDKAQAIYEYVSHIRYVSLSFGVGRYQPHSAAEVIGNRYGDCKDKATLLDALLAAQGLHGNTVLIRSVGDLDREIPSPMQFDHAINVLFLGGKEFWLDSTSGFGAFGYLMPQLRGKNALVVRNAGKSGLTETPSHSYGTRIYRMEIAKNVMEDGTEDAKVAVEIRGGDLEFALRLLLSRFTPAQFEQMINANTKTPNKQGLGHFHDFKASDSFDLKKPMRFEARVTEKAEPGEDPKAWAAKNANVSPIIEAALEAILPELSGKVEKQTEAIEIAGPKEFFVHLEVTGDAVTRDTGPQPVEISKDFANYSLKKSFSAGTLIADAHLDLRVAEIGGERRAEYDAVRKMIHTSLTPPNLTKILADAKSGEKAGNASAANSGAKTSPAIGGVLGGVLKPEDSPAQGLYLAARTAGGNRDFSTSAQLLEEAVAKDSNHKYAWGYLGWVYNAMGKYEKAEVALRRAIALNPSDGISYNNLGQALAGQKKYDEAIPQYQKQIALVAKDKWAHANLGRVYLVQKEYGKALPELETAATISPDDPSVAFNLGRAYGNSGQPDKALAAFAHSASLQPVPVRWNAVAYEMAKEALGLAEAAKYSENAIAATVLQMRATALDHISNDDVRTSSLLAAEWDTLGWIRFQQGNLAEAGKYVNSAWRVHSAGEVGDHLGQIYEKQGRKADAIEQYELTLAGTQPLPETRARLANLLGSDANIDQRIEEAKPRLKEARTIPIKNVHHGEGIAEFWILLAPGPRVIGSKFITGDEELAQFSTDIAASKFPDSFPDSTEVQLLRRGRLSCVGGSDNCNLLLISSQDVRPAELAGFTDMPESVASLVRAGGNVQAAKVKVQVKPVYPLVARSKGIQGTVRLHAIFAKDGTVKSLTLESGDPELVQAAKDAVSQWIYEPTRVNGAPVEVDTTIDVVFALNR